MKAIFTFCLILILTGVYALDTPSGRACRAFFKFEINNKMMMPYAATVIDFHDYSEGKVMAWQWDFGDGNTSREQNPTHIYRHPMPAPNIRINPYRTITLTIATEDCKSSFSMTINIMTGTLYSQTGCPYVMRVKPGFSAQSGACGGWAGAQVFLKDSVAKAGNYLWSTGVAGQEVKNLCPASTYSVNATTLDGCMVASTFVLQSDGSIKEIPVTWWVNGPRENQYIIYHLNDPKLMVEWRMPDGPAFSKDTIPLNPVYGGSERWNLLVRDSAGNIVYQEQIALKAPITGIQDKNHPESRFLLFPGPDGQLLHLRNSGPAVDNMQVIICDLSGRTLSLSSFHQVSTGEVLRIKTEMLKGGFYLCKIVLNNKEMIIRKFLK